MPADHICHRLPTAAIGHMGNGEIVEAVEPCTHDMSFRRFMSENSEVLLSG
jgi:hypothetical protein